jgi:hypothetical protein
MTAAQAELFATLPADAHDPQDERPTIDTPEDFNREFAPALAWEAEKYGTDPLGGDPASF